MFNIAGYVRLGMAPKIFLKVKKLVRSMCYLVIFTAVLSFLSSMVFKAAPSLGTIASNSMMPMLSVGDIVFIQPSGLVDVRVGDIVAYQATPNSVLVHRVVKELVLPGRTYLITKGDANNETDQSIGIPPVTSYNFLGKVLCIDGLPLKVPIIGLLWIQIYNLTVTLTQDKPWSFWAPVLAIVYICWPDLSKGGKIYQKHFTRLKINKRQVFTVLFVAFAAISLFTLWFRNEQYTVGLRVACLLDFSNTPNFNYGSMIPGEVHNNNITMTGAPMFPVKAISVLYGNASLLSSVSPNSTVVEPNSYLSLHLHTEVPAYGKIVPGLYEGTVYIFSSSLWLLVPDEVIFKVFSSFSNIWISAISLELLGTLILASLITIVFCVSEFLAKQAAYTYIWMRPLPEKEATRRHILLIQSFKTRTRIFIRSLKTSLKKRANAIVYAFSTEGKVRNLKIFIAIAAVSYATYIIVHYFIFSIVLECLLLCLYAISKRLRQSEAIIGAMFTHLVYSCVLIAHNAISSVFGFYSIWSLPASIFTGLLFAVLTTPLLFSIFILAFKVLVSLKILGLELETMKFVAFRKAKFVWPNFEKVTVEVIPRRVEVWKCALSRRILTLIEPRRLTAESCRVIKPLEYEQKTPVKIDVERYITAPKNFFEKIEANLGMKVRAHLLTTEEYWIGAGSRSGKLKGGNL